MADLNTVSSLATIASVLAPVGLGAYGVWRRIDRQQTQFQIQQTQIVTQLDFIKEQFGPNGGGLRQAVNEMAHKVDKIDTRVHTMAQDIAELSGRFDQHIVEN